MPASKKFIDINVGLLMPPHAFPPKQISQERTEDLLHKKPKPKKKKKKSRDQTLGSRIQLRCTAIQKFLLDQTTGSERSIRETFGDNPDTSKALRMLVKQHRVKRFGCGGKANPFVYMALIPPNMSELERLEEANAVGMI
jgi:collagen type III alpha|uniref:HTH three-helical bundle domain-containing protein n=1 Tax=Picea sitchensis TaxID=3332 RepID=A9NMS7_PICSI|nr:unknown [Picea sitchensis]ABK26239.1 unknown [Picea sitchensis]